MKRIQWMLRFYMSPEVRPLGSWHTYLRHENALSWLQTLLTFSYGFRWAIKYVPCWKEMKWRLGQERERTSEKNEMEREMRKRERKVEMDCLQFFHIILYSFHILL
jgi:hypothetical protein